MPFLRKLCFYSLALLSLVAVGLFFVLPLCIWLGHHGDSERGGMSAGSVFYPLLLQTLSLSALIAIVATGAAGATALVATFSRKRLRAILGATMTLPLMIGFLSRNYSWLGFLSYLSGQIQSTGPNGTVTPALLYRPVGVVVVMSTVFVPFAYFIMMQGLAGAKRQYYEAARTLGVTDARSFFAITLPLMRRSAVAAMMLCSVLAFGYFVTPRMIGGGQTDFVGNGVLRAFNQLGDPALASAIAAHLFVWTSLPLAMFVCYSVKRRRAIAGDS